MLNKHPPTPPKPLIHALGLVSAASRDIIVDLAVDGLVQDTVRSLGSTGVAGNLVDLCVFC